MTYRTFGIAAARHSVAQFSKRMGNRGNLPRAFLTADLFWILFFCFIYQVELNLVSSQNLLFHSCLLFPLSSLLAIQLVVLLSGFHICKSRMFHSLDYCVRC